MEEYGVYLAKENSNNEAPRADPSILLRTRARGASLRKLSLHGITKRAADRYVDKYRHWEVKMLGWKCNMSNIQASLLLNQLANIEKYLERREEIARKYEEAFSDLRGIRFPKVPKNSKSGRHLFTIWVDPKKRVKALHYLHTKGIGASVNYRAIHTLDYFKKALGYYTGDFPVAERIGDSTISLPLYPKLSVKETDYIIKAVRQLK